MNGEKSGICDDLRHRRADLVFPGQSKSKGAHRRRSLQGPAGKFPLHYGAGAGLPGPAGARTIDALVVATALREDDALVTANHKHFKKIAGLEVRKFVP